MYFSLIYPEEKTLIFNRALDRVVVYEKDRVPQYILREALQAASKDVYRELRTQFAGGQESEFTQHQLTAERFEDVMKRQAAVIQVIKELGPQIRADLVSKEISDFAARYVAFRKEHLPELVSLENRRQLAGALLTIENLAIMESIGVRKDHKRLRRKKNRHRPD